MKIKLLKLTLQNFCGIKHREIDFNGQNARISGDNATGKTTIANAFVWLFLGKDSTGEGDLKPQPLDKSNQPIHNLETSVEAVVDCDGRKDTYKRVLTEVWRKPRGSKTEVLDGNKTSYTINDIPLKEGEWIQEIAKIADIETFKTLVIPSYFSAADWKAKRERLINLVGDVSEDEVIASNPELKDLPSILDGHCVDDFSKMAKSKISQIKAKIAEIPGRITENENNTSVPTLSVEELQANIKEFEEIKSGYQSELALADRTAFRTKNIAKIRTEIEETKSVFLEKQNAINRYYNGIISKCQSELDSISREKVEATYKVKRLEVEIAEMAEKRKKLLAEYAQVKKQEYSGDTTCPTCNQAIPEGQIEKARERFNQAKSEELEAIITKANKECHADMIADKEKELQSLQSDDDAQRRQSLVSEMEDAKSQLDKRVFEETEQYAKLSKKLKSAEMEDNSDGQAQELKTLIANCTSQIQKAMTDIAKHESAEKAKIRVKELEAEKESLAEELLKYEQGQYLCEVFVRTKVDALNESINNKFETLKFKLFHQQKNGGIAEVCEVLVPSESGLVEYYKANTAAQINAGLEVIEVLSRHYQIALPVFVDGGESVTRVKKISPQMIVLAVDEKHKELEIELGGF